MRSIRQVRKRDGRLVDFDESKIADAIYKAALSVGGEDRFLAEETASVVTLFLEKTWPGATPSIEDVQDMVERVLIETGHAATAKAYILYRERRAKLREAEARPRPPAQRELFDSGPGTVLDAAADRTAPASVEAIARRIAAETELPADTAREVAAAVRDRVAGLPGDAVPGGLRSRIVDAELISRDLLEAARRRGSITLERDRLESSLFPKEAERTGTPADRVAGRVLAQYALEEVYPADVAAAHLSGRVRLAGVRSPASIFAASFSADAIRAFGIPGLAGRFRPEAVGNPRRFAAWLGRGVRAAAPHVSGGISLTRLNVLLAPLLTGMDYEDLKEEAWHLLSELADIPGLEIELSLSPPPILASRKARGPDGRTLEETYARFAGTSLQLAAAFLEMRGTAAGLGGRGGLPRLVLTLGEGALEEAGVEGVLSRAVGEALAREPVLFVLDREDMPLLGTSRVRAKPEDATRMTDTATLSVAVGARCDINLPRAAFRAGRRSMAGFLREVEEAADLAVAGLSGRSRFLARAAAAPDGPLAPLANVRGGVPPVLDLERATHSVGVAGLNEAVEHATGHELHESDEAVKAAQRVLGTVRLKCQEAPGVRADVDAAESAAAARRFAERDREEFPRLAESIPPSYTAGIALRADAPVDLAVRLEIEGRLGLAVRTSTVRCLLGADDHPAPGTLTTLLRKTWSNTRVRQVLLGRRPPG